jgi:carbonic anhydrase/acetyltransferase-like protein (isoleucine patch superfamily)
VRRDNHSGHPTRIGSNVFIASHAVISGAVTVGDTCFIGVNATIRENMSVGARSVIGAGALLPQDAPEASVYSPGETGRSKMPGNRLRGL